MADLHAHMDPDCIILRSFGGGSCHATDRDHFLGYLSPVGNKHHDRNFCAGRIARLASALQYVPQQTAIVFSQPRGIVQRPGAVVTPHSIKIMHMNHKKKQLAERRAALIYKAANQRVELTLAFAPLHAPLNIADKGIQVLNYLARRPFLIAGALAIAVAVRPKRWLTVLKNGWLVWRLSVAARQRLMG